MRPRLTIRPTLLALVGLAIFLAPLAAVAEGGSARAQPARRYSLGGAFGIEGLELHTLYIGEPGPDGYRPIRFGSEPTVRSIASGGPADGLLRAGDVIVAVDGYLITTREGGRRFAYPTPGEAVKFTIRRDGREIEVWLEAAEPPPAPELTVVPEPVRPSELLAPTPTVTPLPESAPSPQASPLPPSPELTPLAPVPPTPPERMLPEAWLGLGLRCSDCGIHVPDETGETLWFFGAHPEITSVEPGGPAARAGLRAGDRLLQIDAVSVLTEEGGRAFGALEPGRPSRWTIRRGDERRDVTVTPELRPEAPGPVRHTGMLGDVFYEVRGSGRTVVTRSEDDREVLITVGEVTVRLRQREPGNDGP